MSPRVLAENVDVHDHPHAVAQLHILPFRREDAVVQFEAMYALHAGCIHIRSGLRF